MIKPILFAYFVIKWVGAWSQFEGAGARWLYGGLCVSGLLIFLFGLLTRGTFMSLGAFINDGAIGIFVGPILWILFFILYPLGLVDWLANWNWIDSNQGYLLSHASPPTADLVILAVSLLIIASPLFAFFKVMREE